MTEDEKAEMDRLIAPLLKLRRTRAERHELENRKDYGGDGSHHENNKTRSNVDDNDFVG